MGAIAEAFDTVIVSEYEPQFWGYETKEEWDLAWKKMAEEDEAKFHAEIIKYIKGEPYDIEPGTIGETRANIAKKLVAADPSLISPDKQAELMKEIDDIYKRDHAVVIKLSDADVAAAEMSITHEDDLPQA